MRHRKAFYLVKTTWKQIKSLWLMGTFEEIKEGGLQQKALDQGKDEVGGGPGINYILSFALILRATGNRKSLLSCKFLTCFQRRQTCTKTINYMMFIYNLKTTRNNQGAVYLTNQDLNNLLCSFIFKLVSMIMHNGKQIQVSTEHYITLYFCFQKTIRLDSTWVSVISLDP